MEVLEAALLDAIDEPTIIVARGRVAAANRSARKLLPGASVGRDIRFTLRHPAALAAIARGARADLDLERLVDGDASWRLQLRPLEGGRLLLRLVDRSAGTAAEQMRTDFVADASHELRTPLAAIRGYAETLALPDLGVDDHAMFVGRLSEQVERMESLIDDLFTLSRVEADRFVLPETQVDVLALVRSAARSIAPKAEKIGATILLDLPDSLPPVRGDGPQLGQAIDNLVANAVNHGCAGKGSHVTVGARRDGDMIRISVKDDGEGVPADLLPKLSQRFFRVDSSRGRGRGGGTGLGLSIVRRIAERHRGRLDFASVPGEGLEARLDLPTIAVT